MKRLVTSALMLMMSCIGSMAATGLSGSPPATGLSGTTPGAGGGGAGGGGTFSASSPTGYINVKSEPYNAKGDAISYVDGTMAAGSNAFSSASATFTALDVGKSMIVDYAGGSGAALITTIAAFVDAHHVTLAQPATVAVPYKYLSLALALTTQSGAGSYASGDTIVLAGGTVADGGSQSTLLVSHTGVASVAQNANGTGGYDVFGGTSNTSCVVYGTTGSGPGKFSATVLLTNGSISGFSTLVGVVPGSYTTNPTQLSAEPVTGCGGLTGATLSLKMGVKYVRPTDGGRYTAIPSPDPVAQASTSGDGTGAAFGTLFLPAGGFVYGTDDTVAWTAAVVAETASRIAGTDLCIFAPAGHYFISSPMPTFYNSANDQGIPGCIIGEARRSTWIYVSPAMTGDLFSWSKTYPFHGENDNALYFTGQDAGPRVEHLTVLGDRLTTHQQNAFRFYDENSYVKMNDIDSFYMNGSVISWGVLKHSTNGYLTESEFINIRMHNCGNATSPCFDINEAAGTTSQGTNEIKVVQFNVYGNRGTALAIHNDGLAASYNMMFSQVRIEGTQWNSNNQPADLMVIGSPNNAIDMASISLQDVELLDSYPGFAALRISGAGNGGGAPYGIDFHGLIGGGAPMGKGLVIEAGRTSSFYFRDLHSDDTQVTIGGGPFVFGGLQIYGPANSEDSWTYDIDPTKAYTFNSPMLRNGQFANQGPMTITANAHTSNYFTGVPAAPNAVDLQTARSGSSQVAAGNLSVIAGGSSNTITSSGQQGSIGGGFANQVTGIASSIPGGQFANDLGRTAVMCTASGFFILSSGGDAQECTQVMRCSVTDTSTCRLTVDGLTAGATNCVNIPGLYSYAMQIIVSANDTTTPATYYSWVMPNGILNRGTTIDTTSWVGGTPLIASSGTVTGLSLVATADTVNGCLNLTFTPPNGNTDRWAVVARVHTAESR